MKNVIINIAAKFCSAKKMDLFGVLVGKKLAIINLERVPFISYEEWVRAKINLSAWTIAGTGLGAIRTQIMKGKNA